MLKIKVRKSKPNAVLNLYKYYSVVKTSLEVGYWWVSLQTLDLARILSDWVQGKSDNLSRRQHFSLAVITISFSTGKSLVSQSPIIRKMFF